MMQMNNNTPSYRTTPWGMPSQPKKKVVSIPVQFVGSDSESTRNNSATKIQKVVRGFLVRNSMRRIKAVSVEVEEMDRKVSVPETKELIRRDQKERVKMSETIMNLLLRLDSVRVLNYYAGVRDCRKSVIKKAIALQEMVDQMMGPTHQEDADADAEAGEAGSVGDSEGKKMEGLGDGEEKMEVEEKEKKEEEEEEDGEDVEKESVGTSMVEEVEDNCLVKEEEEEGCKGGREGEGDYENNKSRELLEKMLEDNERMMGMMAQLFDRNEMQTRLLNALSHRVEQLERAYACDKLRRKKRRNADAKHKQTDTKSVCT